MSRWLVRFSGGIIVLALGQGMVWGQISVGGNGSNTTDSTAYSGSQSLTKTGSNTVTLTAANSYTGTTTISAGTLQVGNGGTTGTLGSGNVVNNATLVINRGNAYTVGSVVSGTGDLVQAGSGTTTVGANTYTGATIVNGGRLQMGPPSGDIRNYGSSSYSINNGSTLGFGGVRFDFSIFGGSARTVTFGTSGGNTLDTGSGVNLIDWVGNTYRTTGGARNFITGSSGFNLGGSSVIATLDVARGADATSDLTVSSFFWNNGGIAKTGNGILTLTGNNTYTGGTTINAGTLALGAANRLADTGAVAVNGGTFNLGGFSDTVGAVSLAGGSISNGTLTGSSYAMQSGNVSAVLAGSGALTKSTTNTVTLAGANTYTGTTTISAGTLQVGDGTSSTARAGTGALSVGGNTLSINLNGNATLGNSSVTSSGLIQNLGSGRVTLANGSITGTVDGGSGGIVLANLISNDFSLRGDVTFGSNDANRTIAATAAGATARIVNAGSFWWIGSITAANALSLDVASGVTVSLNGSQAAGNLFYNNLSGSGNFTYNGNATGFILGTSTLGGTLTAGGRDISFGNGGATGAAGSTRIVANSSVAFNSTTDNTYSGVMSGGGGLTKSAANVLTLTGSNTYSGTTTISAGTLQVGDGGATGTLGSASVINNGTLVLNRSNAMTVGNAISGTGSLVHAGQGTTTLTANNTFSGGTIVNAGTLVLSNNNVNILTGPITVNAGATLQSRGTNIISDSSTLTLNGGTYAMGSSGDYLASLAMNGNATVSGTAGPGGAQIILTAGAATNSTIKTLTATGANNQIAVNLGISSQWGGVGGNANLNFNVVGASDSLQVAGVIADKAFDGGGTATSGAITKSGQGTLILTGDNTYTGGATINEGTVQVGNGGTTGNITGTSAGILNNGTLVIRRSDGFGLVNLISGTGSLVQAGTGTTTVSGANTFTGGTTINAGTLALGSANRLADTGAVTVNAGTFNLGGFSDTVGAVTLAGGSITNGTLTGSSYDVRSGNIAAVLAGSGALTKSTTNTVTLAGANTYTGGTTINAGTLALGAANGLADTGAVTVNAGTLNLGGFSDTVGAVTLAGGSITNGTLTGSSYAVQSGNVTAVLAGSGALTKSTTNTVTLAGANTYTGGTMVNAGRLVTASSERLADGGTVTVNSGATLVLGGSETIASLSGAGSVQITGNLTTGTTNSTFSGFISGSGGLNKVGAGSFTLAGANTFQGDMILTGGTLVLASSNALWRGGVVTLNSGTTLTVNQRTFVGALDQLGGTINGAGELVSTLTKTDSGNLNAVIADGPDFAAGILKRTAGTTTVGAANTFTGMINLQGGTLQLGAGGSFAAASSLVLSPGGTMNLNNKSQTFSSVSGTGGTVALGSGALTVSGAENSNFGGTISGTGSLTKGGTGDFELTGVSSYTGTTMVSGGTLIVAAGGSIASSSIATVGADAQLKVNGTAGAVSVSGTLSGSGTVGALTLSSGGTLAVGNSPGLLTASSANWNVGSAFQFEIVDALGTAGTDWDLFSVTGQLNLGGISAGNKMLLTILSTDLQNYDVDTEYSWVFAQAASLAGTESWASGLDVTDRFAITSNGFNGGTQPGGGFAVVTGTSEGGLATLSIKAVPEPSSASLLVVGIGGLLALRRRRKS